MARPAVVLALCLALLCLALPAVAVAARGPVVAVLDSGVDARHPALRGAMWRGPDGRIGIDLVDGDRKPADPRGHGTHIAGLIARRGRPHIMAVRILGRHGRGSTADLVEGIDYAIAHGARIINLSVGYYEPVPELRAALLRASAAGVVVVAAAGNGGEDSDRRPVYPAAYRTPGMIVVGAARADGRLAAWSAHGSGVDLAARGVGLRSTLPGGRFGRRSGTSQAAALVSRDAARLLAARPQATAAEVRGALLEGVRRTATLAGRTATGGVLDLGRAKALLLGG